MLIIILVLCYSTNNCLSIRTLLSPAMATIRILQGVLKGSKRCTDGGTEYFEFLGIPYAKPPVGNLRFKSPQLPEPWDGIKDATAVNQEQVACQIDMFNQHPIGTEDCLYLNVYTPTLPSNIETSETLPVMFLIHGGGFLHGNGVIKTELGPDYLIENNVILVTINYRLGIFGFLSLEIPEAAGNMGLKDQVQALIWVQNNISKFGGDKNNVTIFGNSAGAASVEYLILSHRAEGLFHKAILQSGSSLNHWAINYEPAKLIHEVIKQLRIEGASNDPKAIYKYLMTCPPSLLVEESMKVIQKTAPERLYFGFVPTIEKDFGNGDAFLITYPHKLLKEGKFNKVSVIQGFCEMEGYLMKMIKPSAVENLNISKNFLSHWAYDVEETDHSKFNAKFVKHYSKIMRNTNEEKNRIINFFSDYDFISGIWNSGLIMSDYGIDVYFYKFCYDGKINFLKNAFNYREKGAAHVDDVGYIFKTSISNLADESDINVRKKITKMWTNFAKARYMNQRYKKSICVLGISPYSSASKESEISNPVLPEADTGLPTWPKFTRSCPNYLKIDKTFTVECEQDTSKLDLFTEIYEKYQK